MAITNMFYSLLITGTEAQLDIYGDITSWASYDEVSGMSANKLSKRLEELDGVSTIYVNINSYGGEVAEGIAIYNALRRHPAQIVTRCDGMACSIASVIFMAGDLRQMYDTSMLMIHNASTLAWGTPAELRKAAEDAEKITSMSKAAYMAHINLSEDELTDLMDAETWIDPQEALEWGFATEIVEVDKDEAPSQNARASLMSLVKAATAATPAAAMQAQDDDDDTDDDAAATPDDDTDNPAPDDVDDGEIEVDDDDATDSDNDADDDDDDKDKDDKAAQRLRSFVQLAFK